MDDLFLLLGHSLVGAKCDNVEFTTDFSLARLFEAEIFREGDDPLWLRVVILILLHGKYVQSEATEHKVLLLTDCLLTSEQRLKYVHGFLLSEFEEAGHGILIRIK